MLIYIFQLITNMYPITILWIEYIVRVHVVLTKYELIRRWNDQFILVYLQYQMGYYRIRWYDSFNRRKLFDHDELHRSTQDEFTLSINNKKKKNVRQFWLRMKINMSVYLGIRMFWWILLELWTWSIISSYIFLQVFHWCSMSLLFFFLTYRCVYFISVDILHKNECFHTDNYFSFLQI